MAHATHLYAVAIGSNRPHGRFGRPADVVEAAIARLDQEFGLFDASPIVLNAAYGGAGRDFANAVALVESSLEPAEMLKCIKMLERAFGRRQAGAGGHACSTSTSSSGVAANSVRGPSPFRIRNCSTVALSWSRWQLLRRAGALER